VKNCQIASLALFYGKTNLTITTFLEGGFSWLNKTKALLDRKEIRDAFDIEFLLRSGVELPADKQAIIKVVKIVKNFKKRDYYVTLGSLLESTIRDYYKQNGFIYLIQKLNKKLSYM
jgi:hypothetical protein